MTLEYSVEKTENTQEQEKIKSELLTEATLDSKMKEITNRIEFLKEKEIHRLVDSLLEINVDKDSMKTISKIFECLFGEKESMRLVTNILNEKRDGKHDFKIINKTSRSMSDTNSLKNIGNLKNDQTNQTLEARKILKSRYSMTGLFSDFEDVNFKYNFLYNKVPKLQNQFPDSTYLKFNMKKLNN